MTVTAPPELEPSHPPARRLSAFSEFAWGTWIRRVLLVGLIVLAVVATVKTLTLPARGPDSPSDGVYRWSGDAWRDFLVAGVAEGAILALIALGYSLVYGILRMINFAHGEVFMMGAFGSLFVAEQWGDSGFLDDNAVVAVVILLVLSMLASVLVAVLLERVAYRPLRNAPRLVPLITAIGASLFLQNTARGFFGAQAHGYPSPDGLDGDINVVGFEVPRIDALSIVATIVLVIALDWFVAKTRTGRSMRAVAADGEIAKLMGIDVDRVVVTTFVIGGMLAGFAAVMFSLKFGQITFATGFRPGIAAFTAAVLGGIGSIRGAALGGLLVGLLRNLGPALLAGFDIPSAFQLEDAFTFLVLVLVLLYRPGGLLGSAAAEKL